MCANKLIPIFVYGTIIPIADQISMIEPVEDSLVNYDMYDMGHFPAIVPGTGTVKGRYLMVTEGILAELDRYEGLGVLYERTEAITEGGRPVQVYTPLFSVVNKRKIEGGDWMSL